MLTTDISQLLDTCFNHVAEGDGAAVVDTLCTELACWRHAVSPELWRQTIVPLCREHRIHQTLLEDPYTWRAYTKPRGYAGDAEMLDFLYTQKVPPGTSNAGEAVFRGTTGLPNGQSVVDRRNRLAKRIDRVCDSRPNPRILSIACGHLREAQQSAAVQNKSVGEFIALDQDEDSLAIVASEQSCFGIRTVQASVISVIRKNVAFENLDFVYAAGLLDYLSESLSRRLIKVAFEMLSPGGRLLVANFTPDNHGRAYMECFMDWNLIYRNEAEMEALTPSGTADRNCFRTVYRDEGRNIVYLELMKH